MHIPPECVRLRSCEERAGQSTIAAVPLASRNLRKGRRYDAMCSDNLAATLQVLGDGHRRLVLR